MIDTNNYYITWINSSGTAKSHTSSEGGHSLSLSCKGQGSAQTLELGSAPRDAQGLGCTDCNTVLISKIKASFHQQLIIGLRSSALTDENTII